MQPVGRCRCLPQSERSPLALAFVPDGGGEDFQWVYGGADFVAVEFGREDVHGDARFDFCLGVNAHHRAFGIVDVELYELGHELGIKPLKDRFASFEGRVVGQEGIGAMFAQPGNDIVLDVVVIRDEWREGFEALALR